MSDWIIEYKKGRNDWDLVQGASLNEAKEAFLNICIHQDMPFEIISIVKDEEGKEPEILSQSEVKEIDDEIEWKYWAWKEECRIEQQGLKEAQDEVKASWVFI